MNETSYLLFAQCSLGLESLLTAELTEGGFSSLRPLSGGVELRANEESLWRVCLASRLAEGVRVRLKPFVAREFGSLKDRLKKLPLRAYLPAGSAVRLAVTCHKSKLWHSGAVAERVGQVLSEHAGFRVLSADESAPAGAESASFVHRLFVRIEQDQVQLSLDVGGERLHRRGYRAHVAPASLRETLAAALVRACAQQLASSGRLAAASPRSAAPFIWDPFCGAGTIVLEALQLAQGALPGGQRKFAFESFRGHDEQRFAAFRTQLGEQKLPVPAGLAGLRALGSDASSRAIQAAEHNCRLARASAATIWLSADIEAAVEKVPQGAWVVTNPPYGKRLEQQEPLHKLRRVLARRADLGPVMVLLGGEARQQIPAAAPALFHSKNGGLSVSARLLRP